MQNLVVRTGITMKVADGFRAMAVDAMNALHEVLMQPRLNRKRLEAIYDDLNKNL